MLQQFAHQNKVRMTANLILLKICLHTCNKSVMLGIKKHARDALLPWPHFIVGKDLIKRNYTKTWLKELKKNKTACEIVLCISRKYPYHSHRFFSGLRAPPPPPPIPLGIPFSFTFVLKLWLLKTPTPLEIPGATQLLRHEVM